MADRPAPKQVVSFRFSPVTVARIDAATDALGLPSRQAFVDRAVERALTASGAGAAATARAAERQPPPPPTPPAPAAADNGGPEPCQHPAGRRLGRYCAACGAEVR